MSPGEDAGRSLQEVCELAAHVIPRLNRRLRPSGSELGMGMISALFTVDRHGPLRSGDLARLEAVTAPTMTRMIASLEERGHVVRRRDPADGRACLVEITERGTQALTRARRDYAARIEELLADLPAPELSAVDDALMILARQPGID